MAPDASTAARRAVATFRAIRRCRLFSRRRSLYGRWRWFGFRSYENLWPFADAWSAVTTLASMPEGPDVSAALEGFTKGLGAYSRAPGAFTTPGPLGFGSSVVSPLGRGGDRFFDDNAWLGLAMLHQHDRAGGAWLVSLAARLLAFVTSGWSSEPSWSHPGGIRWKEPISNRSRNTCSNAPAAELAALVHQRTGDHAALEWALGIYAWVRAALLGPDDLYLDQISPEGTRNPAVWTYNQGTMIGAGVLLHQITGEAGFLDHATATASSARRRFTLEELLSQDAAFNAVYFRNLLLLGRLSPESGDVESAAAYGDAMWERARDPATGLFARGSPPSRDASSSNDASPLNQTAPMIEIYALVAGAEPHA